MSIESLLADVVEALNKNTAALKGGSDKPASSRSSAKDADAEDKPAARRRSSTKDDDAEEKPAARRRSSTKDDDAGDALDFEADIKPMLLKLNKAGGRDALLDLFEDFGVEKGDELKPAQFVKVLAAIKKAIKAAEDSAE